jgi:ferredoxin-NADP reductase
MTLNQVNAFWRTAWLKPLNDAQAWNTILQSFNPLWSITRTQAKVLRIESECAGVFSLYLKPNRLFKGFKAGQHIALELDVDGKRKSRTFSISNAPQANGVIRLTIKINPNGWASKAASQLKPGQIVGISQASGVFVPAISEQPVLLIAAGSGITPIMSMLLHWSKQIQKPNAILLMSFRTAEHMIFSKELETLAQQWPELVIIPHFSQQSGHLFAEQLPTLVADYTDRMTYLCGPTGLMDGFSDWYKEHNLNQNLKKEQFGQWQFFVDEDAESFSIFHNPQQANFAALRGQSILEAAEASGLKPTNGCRRGICMTCQCKKKSGVVHNHLTNQASSDGEEWIQLCISTPLSNIQLDL